MTRQPVYGPSVRTDKVQKEYEYIDIDDIIIDLKE